MEQAPADTVADVAAPASAEEEPEKVSVPVAIKSFPDSRPCNVLVHDDHKAYEPVFPRSLSLESCEGDVKAANLEFTHDTAVHVKGIQQLQSSGDFIQTPPIPLYHAHVLWSFALRIERVKDQKSAISLVSIGPHLGLDNSEKKGSLGRNQPRALNMPRVLGATMSVIKEKGEEEEEGESIMLSPGAGGALAAQQQYTAEELVALAGGEVLRVRLRLIVSRSYFALSKIIDLKATTTVTDRAEGILDLIVRGERPPGYDWAITVAESEVPGPGLFFVHKAALGSISDIFKVTFQTSHSYEDQVLMVTGESRCIVPALTTEDMKVVVPLVYGLYAPLPERWQRVSALGRTLCRLFKADLMTGVVFPQWERALCAQALAVDKSLLSSFVDIFRVLTIVWSCPYGSMPVAKRVAVGVLADMVHGKAGAGDATAAFINDTMLPSLGDLGKTVHVAPILSSMTNHLVTVSAVRKKGLAPKDVEWK